MLKKLRFFIVIGVIVFGLIVAKNIIAKVAIEKGVKAATGLEMKIGSIDIGIKKTHFGINGLELLNPKGFEDPVMFEAPKVFVDYNLGAMIKGKIHLEDVELNLEQLVIVKNKDGVLNLDALKMDKSKEEDKGKEDEPKEKKEKGEAPEIQIDHIVFKVGKVIYKDYSKSAEPEIKQFDINISEELENVTDPQVLVATIIRRAITKTTLAKLANFDIKFLSDVVSKDSVNILLEKATTIKDKIKLPFGGE